MKMGFNTTGNSSTSGRTTQAVNLGYLRNRIASTTRKFNYCKEHSTNPSLCINQFINITPPPFDGSLQVMVDASGDVFTSTDYGLTFTPSDISGNPTLSIVRISYDGTHKVAIEGDSGDLYVFNNNTWTQNSNQFFNIDISADGQYQTATSRQSGRLFRSTNYGNNWTQIINEIEGCFTTSLSSSGQQQVAACASDIGVGTVYTSSNYGFNWTQTAIDTSFAWVSANISGDGSIITAGAFEGIIKYSSNGSSWNQATTNWSPEQSDQLGYRIVGAICSSYNGKIQVFISWFVDAGGGASGFIYLSTDGGKIWNVTNVPQLFYTSIAISNSGKFISAVANDGNGLYSYFRSTNYGYSFEKVNYGTVPLFGIDIN